MFRRLFVAAMLVAMGLSGCGRQVTGLGTPSGTAGLPSGNMLIRFRTQGTQDFNTYQYAVVFNTTGSNVEPYANAYSISSFSSFSYALVVGTGGGAGVSVLLFQYYPVPGTQAGYSVRQIPIPNGLLQFLPNSNGTQTEFQLTFSRSLFNIALPTGTTTPSPVATAVASPTATPSGAPSPTATPSALPGLQYGNPWNLNFFVLNNSSIPVDAFGATGINDTSFKYSVDITSAQDNVLTRPLGSTPSGGPPATIIGAEVINTP